MAPQGHAPPKAHLETSHELLSCTAASPAFAYAHLELVTDGAEPTELDNLQVRSYCSAALRQFLGITGEAISIDILKAQGADCWLRVPRQDLGPFAAAVTAWTGATEGGSRRILRVKQCSDWLGAMVGADGQELVWSG